MTLSPTEEIRTNLILERQRAIKDIKAHEALTADLNTMMDDPVVQEHPTAYQTLSDVWRELSYDYDLKNRRLALLDSATRLDPTDKNAEAISLKAAEIKEIGREITGATETASKVMQNIPILTGVQKPRAFAA